MRFLSEKKTIDELEEENDRKQLEMSIEEKQSLIAEARRRYGPDWKKFLNFHSGMDWNALKFRLH
jgi:hypothetical protein